LKNYTISVCEEYGVEPALIFAVIEKESTFNVGSIGDGGNSLGLMQIQPRWNQDRMARLNCWDLMDPYQNIRVGVDLIAELFAEGYSVEGVLMAYNGGRAYANYRLERGIVSEYAKMVMEFREQYV
jgi:soluble lytic murein transglycosylase-like protein